MYFGSRTVVPVSWMCKKQTSVSDSSTVSEIISLDDGLRMDGPPALDLWDIVIEVLRSTNKSVKPNHNVIEELVRGPIPQARHNISKEDTRLSS